MATILRRCRYRCNDDCEMSGCPGHVLELEYQSTSDAYAFKRHGEDVLYFERGQLEAMLHLLRELDRVDAVQLNKPRTGTILP